MRTIALLLLSAALVTAQQTTIAGTVLDPTGAVVPNAKLLAKNTETGAQTATLSDAAGEYRFAGLAAGHFAVDALVPGFRRFHVENLALVSGGSVRADVRLEIGSLQESVTILGTRGAPAMPPRRIRVGGNVQPGALLKQVKPVYPAELQAQGIEGITSLRAVISKDGTPLSLQVSNSAGNAQLDAAALAAVSQWRYRPTLLNGEPVEVLTGIDINFKLAQ